MPLPPLEADVLGTGTEVGASTDTALGRLRGPLLLADWHRLVAACLAAAGCAGLALALAAGTVPARLRLLSGTGGVPKGGGGGATSGNAASPRNAALMQAGLTAPPTWLLPLMAASGCNPIRNRWRAAAMAVEDGAKRQGRSSRLGFLVAHRNVRTT